MVRNGSNLQLSDIFNTAREGDKFANEVLDEMVYYTSLAVSIAVTAYDPGAVVVGGPVIEECGECFFERIKTATQERMIKTERYLQKRIKRSVLGQNAPVIGAATLVYQELFKLSPVYV
jgi:glucokinase